MPRPDRTVLVSVVGATLLVAGCSASPSSSRQPSERSETRAASSAPSSSSLLGRGLDVCRLPTAATLRRATGLDAEPTTHRLTRVPGYDGVVDACGFGPSFNSSTLTVAVGLAPARPADVARLSGRPVALGGGGRVSRAADGATLTYLRGSTLVRLSGGDPALRALLRAARDLAADVPTDPPTADLQTSGRCAGLDVARVRAVLGAPVRASRSLAYADRSATCSWATGTGRNARTLTVALYSNAQAGPFLADSKLGAPHRRVPGVPGDAFTTSTAAYLVADDGQAVVVTGDLGRHPEGRALPATPALAALLEHAAGRLG